MNGEVKTILLLNVSRSDIGSLSSLVGSNAEYITAKNVAEAIEILKNISVDVVLTDSSSRSSFLCETTSSSSLASIPVLSVERGFKNDKAINTFNKLTEERLLKSVDKTMEELERSRYYERFAYDALPVSIIMYYLDWRPMPYISGNLFMLMGYSTEEVLTLQQTGIGALVNKDDLEKANAALNEANAQGNDRVVNEYRMYKKDGSVVYIQEIATRFVDEDGSVGFIGVFTDITDRHEMLRQLRANVNIMSIVSEHSERIIYYYDFAKDELRAVNVDVAMRAGLADFCVDPENTLARHSLIHADCTDVLSKLLADIHAGKDNCSVKLHMNCLDGVDRWFDVCFTSMSDENGSTIGAVISMLDVTQQHDYEISHARYQQTLDAATLNESVFFEFDLTADIVDKQIGALDAFSMSFMDKSYRYTVEYLTRNIANRKDQRRVRTYLSTEKLLDAFGSAQRRISDDWKITLDSGDTLWLHCSVQLVDDPYTGNVKMYMSLRDVTESKLKQLNILHQAENDGLTGLYNRYTIENRIEEALRADHTNSVFILIDLDDLKYINDTLGHAQGDRAICSISDELISTFKGTGMEGRLGGDEFLVFLPNYSEIDNLDELVSGLLRRLTSITVGENDDMSLHCSIGISLADDNVCDFASLYKRADIALYHVKNNGKNDYVYFDDSMLETDYKYKSYEYASFKKSALFENLEFRRMMSSFALFYPQITLSNLTKNTSCVLVATKDFNNVLPPECSVDELADAAAAAVHPDYSKKITYAVSREGMLSLYEKGDNAVYYHCRLNDSPDGSQRWIAFLSIFYKNDDGDVCALSLVRNATERTLQSDAARMHQALELAVQTEIDFVCAISPVKGSYKLCFGKCDAISSEGSFDSELAPLCGYNLTDIVESTSAGSFSCSFAMDGQKAYFSAVPSDNSEIVMLVSKK